MGKRKTHEEFVKDVYELIGGEYKVIGKYVHSDIKIEIKHLKCGRTFNQIPRSVLRGEGCIHCNREHGFSQRRKTHDEFVKEVYNIVKDEYKVLGEYINASTKITVIHNKCGNVYDVTPNGFLNGKRCRPCSSKNIGNKLRKTHNEFLEEVQELVGDEYEVLDQYVDTSTKIRFKHISCQNVYKIEPVNFLRRRGYCCFCSGYRKNTEIFKNDVFNLVGNEYTVLGEYETSNKKIEMIHNTCGHIYKVKPSNFKNRQRCPDCFGNQKKNTEIFRQELFELYGDEYEVTGEYEGSRKKIRVLHKKCGHEWGVLPYSILSSHGCPKCNTSKGELKIQDWLDLNLIKYKKEYRFEDCKYKRPLPFDFAIFDNKNLLGLIEFDGVQHFKPVERFGGEEYFKVTQKRDKIKNIYCETNNIPLLRISYKQENIIGSILNEFINELIKNNK